MISFLWSSWNVEWGSPESEWPDTWSVTDKRCDTTATREVPHHDCAIFITRCHVATVRGHCQRQNHTSMTNKNPNTFPALHIPQSNCFITGASSNVVAVGMPLHTLNETEEQVNNAWLIRIEELKIFFKWLNIIFWGKK